ncbi:MAG: hypothetical protein DME99_04890, partial [Verrucomicrobia bacterium]
MKSTVDVETFFFHSVASSDVFERAIFRYGLAVFSVAIALGINLILLHFNFSYPLSTSFLLAIAITFWYAGTAPGILSVLLSFVAFALFVLPYQVDYRTVLPDGSTKPVYVSGVGASHIEYFVYFALVALLMSWFSSSRRRAEQSLSQARSDLETKVKERTAKLSMLNEELHGEIAERGHAEDALRESEEKYRGLIETSPDAIYVSDVVDGKCVMSNPVGAELAGCPEDQLIGTSIMDTYVPEERYLFQDRIQKLKTEGSLQFERKFVRRNGEVVPVEVSVSVLRGRYLQAVVRDISQRKRREALLAGENKVLEMVTKGESLANILDSLCLLVEEQSSDVLASILLMDPNGKQLRHGGAPNLPKTYTQAIDGAFNGPAVGSCGTAACRAEQVIVSDITTDPLWTDFRDLALTHSLRACWSTPIFSSEGKVIGTFAMYYREPRSPTSREQETIKHITHLAGVAIQRKLAEAARRESEAYLAEAQRLSHTGSWAWAPATGEIRYWSEETYRVLGFDQDDGPPRFEIFLQRLCSEDQERVRALFEKAIREKAEFETDYAIVHPSGATRNIHAVGHPVCDETGQLVEFVGTVIDVTENKRSEEALRASEQVARGQVEALTYSLDVLATAPAPDKFIGQMLSTIGRLLNAQSVTLWLFDQSTDSLVLRSMADDGKLAAPDP